MSSQFRITDLLNQALHEATAYLDGTVAPNHPPLRAAHPVLDGLRVVDYLAAPKKPAARRAWVDAWRQVRPGSDPARAMAVAEPLAHLAYAVRYQEFLDGAEESERIYHLGDPVACVRAALRCG